MGSFAPGSTNQPAHQIVGPIDALAFENRVECFEPLERFLRIQIVGIRHLVPPSWRLSTVQSRPMNRFNTYQNIKATEAKSESAAPT